MRCVNDQGKQKDPQKAINTNESGAYEDSARSSSCVRRESARQLLIFDIVKKSGQVFRTAAGLLGIRLARYFSSHHMSALESDQFAYSQVDLLRTTIQKERCGTGDVLVYVGRFHEEQGHSLPGIYEPFLRRCLSSLRHSATTRAMFLLFLSWRGLS